MPLCFDLDGTLGSFDGGYALLREALGEVWGETPSVDALMACKGSTDWEIVDELKRRLSGEPLDETEYAAYDTACLARFEATFHPQGRKPIIHAGLIEGLHHLVKAGHPLWLVSGNTPRILAFKAACLGISPQITLLGSLPHHDRAGLIRQAMRQDRGPHVYIGDRPHDRDAAASVGIPFVAVGNAVPGSHPVLRAQAEACELIAELAPYLG